MARNNNNPSAILGTRLIGLAMYINISHFSDLGMLSSSTMTSQGNGSSQLMSSIFLTPNGELTAIRHELHYLRSQMTNCQSFFTLQVQQHEGKTISSLVRSMA